MLIDGILVHTCPRGDSMRRSTHKRAQPAHSICYDLLAVERFRGVTLHLVQQFKRVVTIFVLGGGRFARNQKDIGMPSANLR